MRKFLEKTIENIENSPTGFYAWFLSFFSLIIARVLIENWISGMKNVSGRFLFYEFSHTFLFFIISYLFFVWLIKTVLRIEFKKVSNLMLWGFLLILTPPVIDHLISKGKGFWSFYKFDSLEGMFHRFATFFGDRPDIGITYGVRIEVALAIVLIFTYSLIKSRSYLKSAYLSFLSYITFFVLGTFPSWITIFFKGPSKGFINVTEIDIAQMFISPATIFSREINDIVISLSVKMSLVYSVVLTLMLFVYLFRYKKSKIISFLKNARYPQLIYHAGLLIIGMGMGIFFTPKVWLLNFFNIISFFVLLISIFSAWFAALILNDFSDKEVDKKMNTGRPLIKETFSPDEYRMLGWIFFGVSIFFSAIVNPKISLLILSYHALSFLYSSWPIRLKRFLFVATFISAIASIMILFSGFILSSSSQSILNLPVSIIALLLMSYTISLPIKDFKDIEGDKENKTYTVPVVFGEDWGKLIVGSGIFISFVLSVLLLNEFKLFWWAIFFGGISFWIVSKMQLDKKINPHNILWWILGLVVLYGIVLVKIVFS